MEEKLAIASYKNPYKLQGISIYVRTHMTANIFTTNNVVFFFVSDLKIAYYKSF